MIGPWRVGDLEVGTEVGGTKLGDQFFESVSLVTKALAKFPVETMLCTAAVNFLMQDGRIVGFPSAWTSQCRRTIRAAASG